MLFDLLALSAAVLLHSGTAVAQSSGTPCASVRALSAAYVSMFPQATQALVSAQVAEECLKSVPIDKEENLALIDELKLYTNWQSNLAYLIEPPKGYTEDRVDIVDSINEIRKKLEDDEYDDEYTFQTDLTLAYVKAYDFHFGWRPDIRSVFRFRRGNVGGGLKDEFGIVSVSKDGKELPKLYNYYDIIYGEKEGWTASPITEINNQSAETYLENWSKNFEYHEDHARYNRLFPNQAANSMGNPINAFGRGNFPDGEYTWVTHENKSLKSYFNNAIVQLDVFDNVKDGSSFYQRFLNRGPPSTVSKRDATKEKRAEPTATDFPKPQKLHSEAVIGGYYLSGSGYDDVAVLSVPSFSPETDKGPQEFQDLVFDFLKDATSAGKKRLVIDLRGNGGGRVFLGYDLFKQLFPSEDPYGASTFRANQAFNITGLYITAMLENVTYNDALEDFNKNGLQGRIVNLYYSIFNYKISNKLDNSNFTSWEDYFGPQVRNGDNFTVPSRKDLNNFFSDEGLIDVAGYRTRANKLNTKQPFEAKNIVLLQDGGCGSTCAVFTEFMKMQGGVQQIVVGGLPKTGAMQGVSGSKGSQVFTYTHVHTQAAQAYDALTDYQEELNQTELGQLVFAQRPLMRTSYQSNGLATSGINLRDNIRINDTSVTPLEFVYEAADCRLFYTADMIRDVTNVWKKTVDAHFGDKKICVEGSTGQASSLSGGLKPATKAKTNTAPRMSSTGSALAVIVGLVGLFSML